MGLIVQFGNFSSRLHTKNAEDQDMRNKALREISNLRSRNKQAISQSDR